MLLRLWKLKKNRCHKKGHSLIVLTEHSIWPFFVFNIDRFSDLSWIFLSSEWAKGDYGFWLCFTRANWFFETTRKKRSNLSFQSKLHIFIKRLPIRFFFRRNWALASVSKFRKICKFHCGIQSDYSSSVGLDYKIQPLF